MQVIKGDLIKLALAGEFDAIIHGCNCFCAMGAGIARQIRAVFPQAYLADLATVAGDKNKLGSYSIAYHTGKGRGLTIVNGYTQYQYAGRGTLADYEAISTLFSRIKEDFTGQRIGYPKIGAGLAGGDWQRICSQIDRALEGEDHTLVEYVSA